MKKKIIIIILLFFGLLFGTVMTYSFFNNDTTAVGDQEIAKFVFESSKSDHIDISLVDLKPGDTENYLFSVTNKDTGIRSDVTINYQISVSTYHFMPLDIKLYNTNSGETLVLICLPMPAMYVLRVRRVLQDTDTLEMLKSIGTPISMLERTIAVSIRRLLLARRMA